MHYKTLHFGVLFDLQLKFYEICNYLLALVIHVYKHSDTGLCGIYLCFYCFSGHGFHLVKIFSAETCNCKWRVELGLLLFPKAVQIMTFFFLFNFSWNPQVKFLCLRRLKWCIVKNEFAAFFSIAEKLQQLKAENEVSLRYFHLLVIQDKKVDEKPQ